jgi:hypothetical protein
MSFRFVLSVLINLAGMLGAVLVLWFVFGPDATVQAEGPDAARQLLALIGAMVVGFACGLLSSSLLRKALNTHYDFLRDILREERNREAH